MTSKLVGSFKLKENSSFLKRSSLITSLLDKYVSNRVSINIEKCFRKRCLLLRSILSFYVLIIFIFNDFL